MNEDIPMKKMVGPLREWTNRDVIRQWWYLYYEMLRPGCPEFIRDEFMAIDKEVADRKINKTKAMTREGAEDLASRVDRLKAEQGTKQ